MRGTVHLGWDEATGPIGRVKDRKALKWHSLQGGRGSEARRARPELARIGTHLRALYQEVEKEPVPERLQQLLERMAKRPA